MVWAFVCVDGGGARIWGGCDTVRDWILSAEKQAFARPLETAVQEKVKSAHTYVRTYVHVKEAELGIPVVVVVVVVSPRTLFNKRE